MVGAADAPPDVKAEVGHVSNTIQTVAAAEEELGSSNDDAIVEEEAQSTGKGKSKGKGKRKGKGKADKRANKKRKKRHIGGEVDGIADSGQAVDPHAATTKHGAETDGNVGAQATARPGDDADGNAGASKKELREAKKAAEMADFQARCAKGTTVILDLEWESKMGQREIKSLIQQIAYCYGINRAAPNPVRVVLSGLTEGPTLEGLKKFAGFPDAWAGITVAPEPYFQVYASEEDRKRLVYLTADSETVLEEFDPNDIYIIGGIVDHNRLKGYTFAKADEQGIRTASFPISQHIDMGAYSRVLAVNHCLDIVVTQQRLGDWRATFSKCVPGRKRFLDGGNENSNENGAASRPSKRERRELAKEGGGQRGSDDGRAGETVHVSSVGGPAPSAQHSAVAPEACDRSAGNSDVTEPTVCSSESKIANDLPAGSAAGDHVISAQDGGALRAGREDAGNKPDADEHHGAASRERMDAVGLPGV